MKYSNYKFVAHRGFHNSSDIPENSTLAFELAIKNNFPIELDVHLTSDKELVVFHDENLRRMTGLDKEIEDCTTQELNKLFLNNTIYTIPTLDEVLKLVNCKVPLLIEIKNLRKVGELESLLINKLSNYKGEYIIEYSCDHGDAVTARSFLKVNGADTVPPVIAGASDKLVYVGGTVSYREGVTVTDNTDQNVQLKIDASGVNLTAPGVYPVIYSATDCRGNTATVTVSVNVVESDTTQTLPEDLCTREEFDALCRNILNSIVTDKMTEREKAEAIFNRVNSIKYVYTEDCLNWMSDAYIGLTTGRGDCVNYAAASKALLTLAGIPNYDLQRYGGDSEHFWQIVYVDGGWYHFDACPTSRDYPLRCFLLTEEEVAEYTAIRTDKPNYYVYDNDACPYEVVKSRNEE